MAKSLPDEFYNKLNPRIPIGHCTGYENKIRRREMLELLEKKLKWNSIAGIFTRDILQYRRLCYLFF
ncbi:unnamed protein product [marine sediment metagenome]|uniref:Uncharacterized protein n=1 Tax=marine sediment metagenome TaxID=412755 RepID=X1VTR2_9ZZZZ